VLSDDGSRIFWTDENTGNLYVREDSERTVLIATGAYFQTASVDGSEVFFTKGEGLYQYDIINGSTSELANSGVQGLVGASADASYVYFVDTHVLGEGEGPIANRPNLYLAHEGKFVFVATMSRNDDETPSIIGTNTPYADWYGTFAGGTAEFSMSGRYLAFIAIEPLTGYDNN
jgi:hypothetical protein